jgi:hypothetical protein
MTLAYYPARNPAADRPEGRDYLSFTAISTYQACPLRYYYKYVAKLPEETIAAGLLFGTAMHRAVQYHFEQLLAGQPSPTLERLYDIYWEAWHQQPDETIAYGKSETALTLDELAERMLWSFLESNFAHPEGRIIGIEESLRGEVVPGCPELVARVDLLVDDGKEWVLSDFKTSRSPARAGRPTDRYLLRLPA